MIKESFFFSKNGSSHHQKEQKELGIKVDKYLLKQRVEDIKRGQEEKLLFAIIRLLLVMLMLKLETPNYDAHWIYQKYEDSKIGKGLLKRVV